MASKNYRAFDNDDDMWFRFRQKQLTTANHLGDYQEIYIESSNIEHVAIFLEQVYDIDQLDYSLFDVTVFDGLEVFERACNSSSYLYRVYSRAFLQSIMDSWWAKRHLENKEIIFD